jgi:hypothetical protein
LLAFSRDAARPEFPANLEHAREESRRITVSFASARMRREGHVPVKRKWLRAVFLVMLAGASYFGVNPKDIEYLLHIMNETKVEFTIPDEDATGDGPGGYRSLIEIDDNESESPPGISR